MFIKYRGIKMPELTKKIKYYKCSRCHHEWLPKNEDKPLTCPKCRSVYWDREKKK